MKQGIGIVNLWVCQVRPFLFGLIAGIVLFATPRLPAQSSQDSAKTQEDFALAVATAHARTSLFAAGSKPFAIHAAVESRLALHGTGRGTYDNQWVDSQHWRREIRFPDFRQSEMRNDSGHSWIERSGEEMPIRIAELLRVVVVHVPSSTAASTLTVSDSTVAGGNGELQRCFSSDPPPTPDGFARHFQWCFGKDSGLLASQDLPLNTHVVYSNYVEFQGKQEFTHVRVTSGGAPVIELEVGYSALDAHALDGATPSAFMHRSGSAEAAPNPEELRRGTVEYRYHPPLPPGTPKAEADVPVAVQVHLGADSSVLDACVENAPTEAMGEAALQALKRFTFTPLLRDGKPVGNHFYASVWFRSVADGTSPLKMDGETDQRLATGPSDLRSGGSYRNQEPPFVFRYPPDFETLSRAEILEERRAGGGPRAPGTESGTTCSTVLFKAERLTAARDLEVLSALDLSPNCIFGVLDQDALKQVAMDAAKSIAVQWAQGEVAKPRSSTAKGRTFGIASVAGRSKERRAINGIVVTTALRGHVLGWTILGGGDDLEQALAACTLQVGDESEIPLP